MGETATRPWHEVESLSKPIMTGVTSSAVTQRWGCGHAVHSANGDALYSSCPYCYVAKVATDG